jgi:hypothetical protein
MCQDSQYSSNPLILKEFGAMRNPLEGKDTFVSGPPGSERPLRNRLTYSNLFVSVAIYFVTTLSLFVDYTNPRKP